MNRNAILVVAALAVLLLGFFRLRGDSSPTEPAVRPAIAAVPRTPPPGLKRPSSADGDLLVRGGKTPKGDLARGPIPDMAPPPFDPSLDDAPSGARSVWPLNKDGFRGAMDEVRPAVLECYEGWLVEQPDLGGRVVLGLVIEEVDGLGLVTDTTVEESEADAGAFEACLTSVMSEMEFDAPAGGEAMRVTWPFLFAQD